jgi:hypothetical protein
MGYPAINLQGFNGKITVSIEVDGEWVEVIKENGTNVISHIVEPSGIENCIERHRMGRFRRVTTNPHYTD